LESNTQTQLLAKYLKWPLLTAIWCIILAWPLQGVYFIEPNQHMHAFGGDALAIYYNVAYHACHGSGLWLESMNYPHGELIFMTDAQGALSILISYLNLCEYSTGIINGLNAWSIIITAILIFFLLQSLEINSFGAALFSPLIVLLSPPMLRMFSHFGLAYPFLIPLAMLWFLRKTKIPTFEKRDLVVLLIFLFFGFNNPYFSAQIGLFLLGAGGIIFFLKKYQKSSFIIAGMAILILLIPFLVLKFLDPVNDRIGLQWGYFYYYATLEGLIAPPDSIIDGILKYITGKGFQVKFEALMNLGIVVISISVLSVFFNKTKIPKYYLPLLISSTLLFIYASAILLMPFERIWIEDKMGFLLMFKAVGRLAWPIYFTLTVLAVYFLTHWTKNYLIYIALASVWIFEIHTYIRPFFKEHVHPNFFAKEYHEEIPNPERYQAILSIPKMMYWTDNFISEDNFFTQFYSMRLSLQSGLPLVNAMLSRMSIGQTSEAIELISHPYIEKSLPKKFPNSKDILVVLGAQHQPLTEGEQHLINQGEIIVEREWYSLYAISIDDFKPLLPDTNHKEPIWHSGFDQYTQHEGYFKQGALKVEKGQHQIFDYTSSMDTTFTFNAWIKIDHRRYGVGYFEYRIYDTTGELILESKPDVRKSGNVHDDWIRAEQSLKLNSDQRLIIHFNTIRPQLIDDAMLSIEGENSMVKGEKANLVNGYKILKK
jgi:hypothetical protein